MRSSPTNWANKGKSERVGGEIDPDSILQQREDEQLGTNSSNFISENSLSIQKHFQSVRLTVDRKHKTADETLDRNSLI